MTRELTASWQVNLIALGLLVMIPVTVWFGIDFLSPTVNKISNLNKKQVLEQDKSVIHEKDTIKIIVTAPTILALVATACFVEIPIISAALVGSAIILNVVYTQAWKTEQMNASLIVFQLILSILSLVCIVWQAKKNID